ncbi:zinc-binding alcohol dehydrogenase [Microvirga sp. KLBC 81]|uniref:alcohol dehydrogenase catalytic domain-containing protein n=1 Tax=Microvirga sp. KLBC 81 TaxID=1862707 RepID=UPI000D516EB9|nr:alcohol dehydrogenase catalytic domain-containing protein [Microvirga sp. KLBC 81]PVE21691.1 zinc-binding alcohol dehydrogenase [Microvirga sp. KLBC 81]
MNMITTTAKASMCLGPSSGGGFVMRQIPRRKPAADEVEVAVAAASVNPIDVHRAQGYGRRLLSLLGASRFPMVLGNDLAGTVTSVGTGVSRFQLGDCVYGLKPTSAEGTHASHVLVKANYLLPVPEGQDPLALAALPYCFVTMWLAISGAGLTRENASGKSVLVHGAAGGLGTLALQMLSEWGAKVTAIAWPSNFDACIGAGAADVVDCTKKPFASLGRSFDVTLNFATWDDDLLLLGCLRDGALGHATTVHPMLRNFDELGWTRAVLSTLSDKKRHRSTLPKGVKHYAWTLFRPDEAALSELRRLVEQNDISLPIGLIRSLEDAAEAFEHVSKGKPGRALLKP